MAAYSSLLAVLVVSSLSVSGVDGSCRFDNSFTYTSLHPFSQRAEAGHPPAPQIRSVCYNDSVAVCWCTHTELDCSGNNGSLTFVPKVNGTFTFLSFTYNHLEEIGENFFKNVTEITGLNLGDNHYLHYIHPRAFEPLPNLRELFLDYVYALTANYSLLEPVFSLSSLTRLDIRVGELGPMPSDLFYRHPMPRLETLYLHYNTPGLQYLNMTALKPLVSLKTLGVASNSIRYIHGDFARSLEKLNLRYNSVEDYFPHTCRYGKSLYPKLKQLFLMSNQIKLFTRHVCLPRLEYLDLSGNHFEKLYSGMFNEQFFPSLTELYLQYMNKHLSEMQPRAFANKNLKTISLLYNGIYFDKENVSTDSFQGCTGLENLLLGHNQISNDKFIRLFGHLDKLQYIHLGSDSMGEISRETFSGFSNLTTLCMYQNKLMSLPDGAFDSLTALTTLEININQIQTIASSAFSPETRKRLTHLDLSHNPFRCDCDILWFQSWFLSSPSVFSNSRGSYNCSNVLDTDLSAFHMARQACLLDRDTSIFISVVVGLLLVTGSLVAVFFRYRWYLRLLLHEAFRGRGEGWRRRQHAENFDYDLFVSYAAEDLAWVRFWLLPELEEKEGLRLCVHQRDFIPGERLGACGDGDTYFFFFLSFPDAAHKSSDFQPSHTQISVCLPYWS